MRHPVIGENSWHSYELQYYYTKNFFFCMKFTILTFILLSISVILFWVIPFIVLIYIYFLGLFQRSCSSCTKVFDEKWSSRKSISGMDFCCAHVLYYLKQFSGVFIILHEYWLILIYLVMFSSSKYVFHFISFLAIHRRNI